MCAVCYVVCTLCYAVSSAYTKMLPIRTQIFFIPVTPSMILIGGILVLNLQSAKTIKKVI